jgi:hypothetical protein
MKKPWGARAEGQRTTKTKPSCEAEPGRQNSAFPRRAAAGAGGTLEVSLPPCTVLFCTVRCCPTSQPKRHLRHARFTLRRMWVAKDESKKARGDDQPESPLHIRYAG